MFERIRHLVLVGAGHAHVQVLREFGRNPLSGVHLTLITREVATPYSGMLPGFVAGHYGFADFHIDAAALAARAGGETVRDEAIGLDLAERRVLCRDHGPIAYDVLSLDTGSHPNTAAIPGASTHAIPVKPIDRFLPEFAALRERALAGHRHRIVMVGGGAGGVELLLALEHRLRRESPDRAPACTLITGGADILPGFPAGMRARFRAVTARRGIAVRCGQSVASLEAGRVRLADGDAIEADDILWATEAAPPAWLDGAGLALDPSGFLRVDAGLRALGQADIFAAGDMVAFDPRPIPRSGVYAVRAGPVLADNLRATLDGSRPRSFHPQHRALYIVSTGDRHAIATRNGGGDRGGLGVAPEGPHRPALHRALQVKRYPIPSYSTPTGSTETVHEWIVPKKRRHTRVMVGEGRPPTSSLRASQLARAWWRRPCIVVSPPSALPPTPAALA